MYRSLTLVALLAAACAPAGTTAEAPVSPGESRVTTDGSGVDVHLANNRSAAAVTVPAPPARAWEAVRETYTALGIPMGTSDAQKGTYGNQQFVVRRHLGGTALSRYLQCGQTAAGAPIAETYRITLSVMSAVQPAPGGASHVHTQVGASAQSIEGASSGPVPCSSTGVLETRIAEGVGARVRS